MRFGTRSYGCWLVVAIGLCLAPLLVPSPAQGAVKRSYTNAVAEARGVSLWKNPKARSLKTRLHSQQTFATVETNSTSGKSLLGDATGDLILPLLSFADDFSNAGLSRTASGSLLGLNLLASLEPGEPRHANKPGGHSLWMRWVAPSTGVATFHTLGTLFDTVLGVYTGNELGALTSVAANDDDEGLLTSRVRFNAVAGREYHIAVDGFNLAIGQVLLNWTLDTTSALLPVITALSPNQTVGEGETITLSIQVESALVSYQWLLNGAPISGATNSLLKIEKVSYNDVGKYTVRLTAAGNTLLSHAISVQINDTDGTVQRSATTYDKLADLAAANAVPVPRAKSGTVSHGYSVSHTFSTHGSTKEPGEPKHCGVNGGSSEWFLWKAPTNGTAVIDTDGSNFDTVLAVYIGPGTSYATLTNVACDNDSGSNGKTSRVAFNAQAGTLYYMAVDGVNGAQGTVKLNIAVGSAPQIVSQPASKAVTPGGSATMTVTADAFPAPKFQWTFNGTKVNGATNASLTLTSVSSGQFGSYQVQVSNAMGAVLSLPAQLLEQKPLQISSRVLLSDGFHLSIDCPPGTNYVLESTRDFVLWKSLVTNQTASGSFQFVDAAALTNSHSFYRLRSLP